MVSTAARNDGIVTTARGDHIAAALAHNAVVTTTSIDCRVHTSSSSDKVIACTKIGASTSHTDIPDAYILIEIIVIESTVAGVNGYSIHTIRRIGNDINGRFGSIDRLQLVRVDRHRRTNNLNLISPTRRRDRRIHNVGAIGQIDRVGTTTQVIHAPAEPIRVDNAIILSCSVALRNIRDCVAVDDNCIGPRTAGDVHICLRRINRDRVAIVRKDVVFDPNASQQRAALISAITVQANGVSIACPSIV